MKEVRDLHTSPTPAAPRPPASRTWPATPSAASRLRPVIDSGLGWLAQRILGGVPREQKMLKGHLPRVIYHQLLVYEDNRALTLLSSAHTHFPNASPFGGAS